MAAQVIAVIIFVLMFLMIMLDKFERCVVTLTAGAATMVLVFGLCMKSPDAILGTLNALPELTGRRLFSSAA